VPIRVLGFDGDDTLWHSESRFEVTQGKFRDLLQRHVRDIDVDRRLAEMEMKNLNVYGYGVKSFTLSMLETAIQLTQGRIPATDLEVILDWGKRMLQEPTELLDGVGETLRALARKYDLMLITKGDLFDQEGKLARSGLGDLFWGVDVLSEKNVESYQGVFKRRGIEPSKFVMVGNSLRSDVVPAVALGARAIHIPYHVTWQHEQVPEAELPSEGWVRIGSIKELPATLESF
jgi:putative hydrolase of the HAD superfamily